MMEWKLINNISVKWLKRNDIELTFMYTFVNTIIIINNIEWMINWAKIKERTDGDYEMKIACPKE